MLKKLITFIFALVFCSTLFAGQIKQIVFLGDSLTDNGNLYQAVKIIPKSPPYYNGRFSNGPTWAENVGKFLYSKSYVDVENYAVGGSTSIVHNPVDDPFVAPVTLTEEVYDYYSKSLFIDKSTVLYSIWIGANDYLYETSNDTDTLTTNVVANISWAVNSLINQGAKYFLIMNLPDLSRTPYATENNVVARLHDLSVLHNQKLADAINKLQSANPSIKIVYVDIYNVFNDMLANPGKYNQLYHQNINNITDACWTGGMTLKAIKTTQMSTVNGELQKAFAGNKMTLAKNFDTKGVSGTILNTPSLAEAYAVGKAYQAGLSPCADADSHVFWDHIHPTEAVHQILADVVEQDLAGLNI